jgi:hypothetical protein
LSSSLNDIIQNDPKRETEQNEFFLAPENRMLGQKIIQQTPPPSKNIKTGHSCKVPAFSQLYSRDTLILVSGAGTIEIAQFVDKFLKTFKGSKAKHHRSHVFPHKIHTTIQQERGTWQKRGESSQTENPDENKMASKLPHLFTFTSPNFDINSSGNRSSGTSAQKAR